jgi:mediator of RNA polymerase II transcription subunit 5
VFDVESLSHLCRLLYTHEAALDILAIHVKIYDIIFRALLFLEQYDCETVGRDSSSYSGSSALTLYSNVPGDPQTAVTHLGDVVLFVQYTISRFHARIKLYHLYVR